MIEIVINDRLGKKVRIKCKYPFTTNWNSYVLPNKILLQRKIYVIIFLKLATLCRRNISLTNNLNNSSIIIILFFFDFSLALQTLSETWRKL